MEWNAIPELIAEIRDSIAPVQTDGSLRKVLAEDFPRDCSDLPISGGWGYTQPTAIVFIRSQFSAPSKADFVPLEYHIAQKIIYEELIISRPKNYKFSGISMKLQHQTLTKDPKHDHLEFLISCWSDWHWEQLKKEWEANDSGMRRLMALSGMRPGFDAEAHHRKRIASQVSYERDFWFDISDVFDRASA
jgi:hypothetical protein